MKNFRKFKIRNQLFGHGQNTRVGLVPQRTIMVNGVKQRPGERARRGNQLTQMAKKKTK